MKVLVTGVRGQLGHDCMIELQKRNYEAIGVDVEEMDITDKKQVEKVLNVHRPEVLIHCAAWTAVDAAEEEENRALVYRINAEGTRSLAKVCKEIDCKMIYISTDYVFDGQGEEPWAPDCKDYKPLSVYGDSKLQGELAVAELLEKYFIVRVAWVFGLNGNNFIKMMLNVGKRFERVTEVSDQIGTPTYTHDLSRLLVDMAESESYGYYHATNEGGYISWYDFTKEIFRQAVARGQEVYSEERLTVVPVTTEVYGISKATRPYNSRLCKQKLIENEFGLLPDWQDAVSRYLEEIESQGV